MSEFRNNATDLLRNAMGLEPGFTPFPGNRNC